MTRAQLRRINAQLDADDDSFAVEAARAKLSPAELARIDAEVDEEDEPDEEDEDDDLDLDDPDLADDSGAEPEDEEAVLSPAVVMGLGADGVFRHRSADDFRDPVWCRSTQSARNKATSFLVVPE
jgi:hypothetical protein